MIVSQISQEDVDQSRLNAFLDTLVPLTKKFRKAEAEVGSCESERPLTVSRQALLDHLFSLTNDDDWLKRVKQFQAEDRVLRAVAQIKSKRSK